jgi:hypothetical protein
VQIIKPLLCARSYLILKGGLHCVFLVTPPTTQIGFFFIFYQLNKNLSLTMYKKKEPDWNNYEKILDSLHREHPESIDVTNYLGVQRGQLCSFSFNHPTFGCMSETVNFYKRFYSAVLLFILIQEWPITRLLCNTVCLLNLWHKQI